MCLCEVYGEFKPPLKGTYEAYKVMRTNDRFLTDTRRESLKKKGWNIDTARERIGITGKKYPTGFHVWNILRDAKKNRVNQHEEIWLVHVTDIVAEGLNEYCFFSSKKGEVLVARKMKFIKKIEG